MSTPATRQQAREASRPLFEELALKPGDEFPLRSRRYKENGVTYLMTVTPEGYVVHQGEGCEAETFNLDCWHSKETEKYVTTAITPYQPAAVPSRIEFNAEQLRTITDVICVDSEGHRAPPAFVQLFLAACRHSGLDPFLRQIYALNIQGKWTMFVGIDGYRVISERTGLDAGMDGPEWSDDGKTWFDFPFVDEPKFCKVSIWRKGVPRAQVAIVSMKAKKNERSQSWKQDPAGMLAKCAEALARRRAFPADMAVIPQDATFEEPDGTPITRAEVPAGQWREIDTETGEIHEPVVMATEAQRKAIARVWDPKHPNVSVLRERYPRSFPKPGAGVNDSRSLTEAEAADVIALLSTQPEAPATVTSGKGTVAEPPSEATATAATPPVCESHDYAWSEDKAALVCGACGAMLDGPDAPVQAKLG